MKAAKISRFLVVDNDEANTLFFRVVLMDNRHQHITTSTSPAEAVSLVDSKEIQLVITSWEMQPMSGAIFVQKIREKRGRSHLPCLIYTKGMSDQEIQLMDELGLKHFLKMPVDKEKAWEAIDAIIKQEEGLDPKDLILREAEGFIGERRFDQALTELERIKKDDERYPKAQALVGEIYFEMEKIGEAEMALKTCLSGDPQHAPALQLLARVHARNNNHEEAVGSLVEMLDRSPENLQSLLTLSAIYCDAHMHTEAKATLDKVEKLDPGNEQVAEERGKIAFKEGDLTLAAQHFQGTKNGDQLARYFNNMAIALVSTERFDEGIQVYTSALKVLGDPSCHKFLLYNLGLAQRKKGDLASSLKTLGECYLASPDFEKAYAAFIRVGQMMAEKRLSYDKDLVDKVKGKRNAMMSKSS